MRKLRQNIFLIIYLVSFWGLEKVTGADYWQQHVDYEISVELDHTNRKLSGHEKLTYYNHSPDTLSEIYFHLYPNAFKKGSVMDREARAASINLINSPDETGWMRVNCVFLKKMSPAEQPVEYRAEYNSDSTLLKLQILPHLLPGEILEICANFSVKIRRFNVQYDKSGYKGNFYEISQWYPKPCVYDKNGWDASPYHYLGEFYGEFGNFGVTIIVPDSFVVAGTGEVLFGDPGWSSSTSESHIDSGLDVSNRIEAKGYTRTIKFFAEDVHDFVWTASPDLKFETGNAGDVKIHVLYEEKSANNWKNQALNAAIEAVNWLERNIGKFPYPQITVCQGLTDGGMEYPMMTVLGYYEFSLVFHEICHMYFYGALANNEHKDGWLDEGLVTYLTDLNKQDKYGVYDPSYKTSMPIKLLQNQFKPYFKLSTVKLNSLYNYFYSGFEKPMATESHLLNDSYHYGYNVYTKPTQFFQILNYLLGEEKFFEMLRIYYERWQFKHVDMACLKTICAEVSEENLDDFFNQWINGIPKVDYACLGTVSTKTPTNQYMTQVHVKNLGNTVLPFETELITAANDTIIERRNGIKDQATIEFLTDSKVDKICLDPRDILLDQNRFNNGTPKVKVLYYPEFTSMYYLPRDEYALFLWQRIWYNEIDGAKVGINILGSYLNRYYVMRNYLWYNFKSNSFDYNFSYSMPWEKINRQLWRHLNVINCSGKFVVNANLLYSKSRSFTSGPAQNYRIGFVHFKTDENNYNFYEDRVNDEILNVRYWEPGILNKLYFQLSANTLFKRLKHNLNLNYQIADGLWGSEYEYSRIAVEYKMTKFARAYQVYLRSFLGYSSSEQNIPVQDKLWIAGGNPVNRFKHYYLRAPATLPELVNYHFPGDGNLKGYSNKLLEGELPLTADKLATVNFEFTIRKVDKVFPKLVEELLDGFELTLFFDGGRIWNENMEENYLFDAGFGFNVYKKILGKNRLLKIYFPIWLSQPNFSQPPTHEPNWKYRWMVSFQK